MCEYLHLSVKEKDSGIKAILIPRERLANDSVSGKTSSSRDVLQDLAVNVNVSVVREDEVEVVVVQNLVCVRKLRLVVLGGLLRRGREVRFRVSHPNENSDQSGRDRVGFSTE